jgi:DNA-binding transcriptional MerR regulator
MAHLFRVGELADLTGVSVRTLHHYDHLGLLRPGRFTEGGHRLYARPDLLRLQQILTLRYLGFPLKQIGELLDRPGFDLVASMRAQRRALRDRIADLQRVDAVLGELLEARRGSDEWRWDLIVAAVAAARDGLDKEGTTMEKVRSYYTPEQLAQFDEIGLLVGAEEIRAIEEAWEALLGEVRANLSLDPTDPRAQEFAARWDALHERTMNHYQAHPELLQAIRQNYEAGRFEGFDRAPQAADLAFIERVKAARTAGAG